MNGPKLPEVNNVNRIVINGTAVWHEEHNSWHKTDGGPGFNRVNPCKSRTNKSMIRFIHSILYRTHRVKLFKNQDLILYKEEYLYRWWISGDTLNLVSKDLP
jgi:hypothetical protein